MTSELELIQKLPEIKDPTKFFLFIEKEMIERIALMKKYRNQGELEKMVQRFKRIVTKPDVNEAKVSGALISKYYPSYVMKDCVRRLRANPYNSKARLKLLTPFFKKRINASILVYREALIQALIELDSSHVTGEKLNMARHLQSSYLEKLTESLNMTVKDKDEDGKISGKDISTLSASVDQKEQILRQKKGGSFVKECRVLLKDKRIEEKVEIDFNGLINETKITPEQRQFYISILSSIVYLPSAHRIMKKWILLSKKVFDPYPLGALYESKMNRIYAQIYLAARNAGDRRFRMDLLRVYTDSLNIMSTAVSQIKKDPTVIEKACIFEYARLCLAIAQNLPLYDLDIPVSHFDRIQESINLLNSLTDEKGIIEMQAVLYRVLKNKKRIW
ncbi:hypothetical protein WDW89_25890 [Deltaproteobacteria bacterium TL4]